MNDSIELYGNTGNYILDGNVLSFQIGEGQQVFGAPGLLVPQGMQPSLHEHQWLSVNGYQVCMRGMNNALCDEVTMETPSPTIQQGNQDALRSWPLCVYADGGGRQDEA